MSANAAGLPLSQSHFRLRSPGLASRGWSDAAEDAATVGPPRLEDLLSPARWLPRRHADPEIRKVLSTIQTHLSETRRLLALRKVAEAPALGELISLAQQSPHELTLDSAWDLSGAFKRLNLRFGDRAFLASRLEFELGRAD